MPAPSANELADAEAARTHQVRAAKQQQLDEFERLVKLRLAAPKKRPASAPTAAASAPQPPPPAQGPAVPPVYVCTTGHTTGPQSLTLRSGAAVEAEREAVLRLSQVRKTAAARERKKVQLKLQKEREAELQRMREERQARDAKRIEGEAKRWREESEAQRMELKRRQQSLADEARREQEVVRARQMAELRKSRFAVAVRATMTEQIDLPLDLPALCTCGGADTPRQTGKGDQSLVWGLNGWAVPSANCPYKDECVPVKPACMPH
eukprot:SAG31_NODE_2495_length_5606_cov_5.934084_2_plen_265_part_00